MNQDHYLNYAVYNNGKEDYLVKVTSGYFASDAWMKGDEAFNDVAGRKFGGIFADDGKQSQCDKSNVRRLNSDEEFENLYQSSCLFFKVLLKVLELCEAKKATFSDHIAKIQAYHRICELPNYAAAWFERLQISDMPSDKELQMIADCVLDSNY